MPFDIYTAPAEMQPGAFVTPSSIGFSTSGGRISTLESPVDLSNDDTSSVLAMIMTYIFIFFKSLGLELLSIISMVAFQLLLTYMINKYHGEFSRAIKRSVPPVLLPFVLPVAFIVSRLCCTRHPAALRVIDVIEEGIQMSETSPQRSLVDSTQHL